jgi:hypothetical protein
MPGVCLMCVFLVICLLWICQLCNPIGFAMCTEPKFLKIFKCNSAESASAGFQFNFYDIFNDKTLNYRHLGHFSGLLKFT